MFDPTSPLRFPFPTPPEPGDFIEVAPGILWLRLALPFALDHVNLYLIEDDGGWALVDTGLGDSRTRAVWEDLLSRRLGGRRLSRLIVTHYHPDHAGLAGWLAARCDIGLSMPRTEYLICQNLRHNPAAIEAPDYLAFLTANGLAPDDAAQVLTRGQAYLRVTTGLPASYRRLRAGDTLRIGGRDFEVSTGGGHAPEQAMLLCRSDRLFLAADQVLARISPNIGVSVWEPDDDPLGEYLASLASLRATVPDGALVLAAHDLPFHGLHQRIDALAAHHDQRCDAILAACRDRPRSAAELLPVLFHRPLDAHQTGFAFAEALAHVNHLHRAGRLPRLPETDGTRRYGF